MSQSVLTSSEPIPVGQPLSKTETERRAKTELPAASGRLVSLDALRGFDMFLIAGSYGAALKAIGPVQPAQFLATQLEHVKWEGFRLYDFIFPLFLFIIGVSLVFSLDKTIAGEGKAAAVKRIIRRGIILFLMGVFYDGGVSRWHQSNVLCGVLQRLALGYLFTGLLYCGLKLRGLVATFVVVLAGYWALWTFVPVPGTGQVSFEEGKNWTHYIDLKMPPYHRIDNEGYLSTFPAIGTCLLGVFAALVLKNAAVTPEKKVLWLVAGGAAMTIAGYLWALQFPIIKRAWTPTYVLVAGGYSCILMGSFYLVIDVWKYQRWAAPFVWIGANAITFYLGESIVPMRRMAERFVGGDIAHAAGRYGDLLVVLVAAGLSIAVMRFLYNRKIFLRV